MARPTRPRELAVWANGLRVGTWRLPSRTSMEFAYADSWTTAPEARPLSLSLPLTVGAHIHRGKVVEAYFDNLLPDSEPIRRRLQQKFQASTGNAFDLLAAIGRDCVGAVQILPVDESPADIRRIEAQPLGDAQVAAELRGVTATASPVGEDREFRISIAGAQEKTALLWHQGKWCRPVGSTPTTHIFKLPLGLVGNRQADFRSSVENEWLCSRILAGYGLPVAHCDIDTFGDQKALVVERFDRQLHSSGKYWLRLMQEDMAQATGTPWHRKYQADGGPGIVDLARILRGSVEAQKDLAVLFKAQVLFWMLAATDGHAKNFSLRILPAGRFQLTPLYDVLSAWPVIGKRANEIPIEKVKMAMALPGERPHYAWKAVQRRHFESLARKLGLIAEFEALLDDIVSRTPEVLDAVQRGLPRTFPQSLVDRVFTHVNKCAQTLRTPASV